MSAFLCSVAHLARVVTAKPEHENRTPRAAQVAVLARANLASVGYRYGLSPDRVAQESGYLNADGFVYACEVAAGRPPLSTPAPVELLKLVRCVEYQSCEIPEWEQSPAADLLRGIAAWAVNRLPGYDRAPWTVEEAVALV